MWTGQQHHYSDNITDRTCSHHRYYLRCHYLCNHTTKYALYLGLTLLMAKKGLQVCYKKG